MADDKHRLIEGYQPRIEKGYQPEIPVNIPTGDTEPAAGYQPTNQGDNPINKTPPGDE